MIEKESEEEMKHEIESYLRFIKETEKEWGKIKKDTKSITYYMLGSDSKNIAVYNLLLGNNKESLKWFKKSAEYYTKSLEYKKFSKEKSGSEIDTCWMILYTSLFSKDKETIKKSLEAIFSIDENYPKKYRCFADYYYQSIAICKKLKGEDKGARLFFDKMKTPKKSWRLLEKGTYFFTEGLIKEDKELCQKGAEMIRKSHSMMVGRALVMNWWVNFPLTAFLIMSKMLGIDVEIKDKYVPEFLLEGVNKI